MKNVQSKGRALFFLDFHIITTSHELQTIRLSCVPRFVSLPSTPLPTYTPRVLDSMKYAASPVLGVIALLCRTIPPSLASSGASLTAWNYTTSTRQIFWRGSKLSDVITHLCYPYALGNIRSISTHHVLYFTLDEMCVIFISVTQYKICHILLRICVNATQDEIRGMLVYLNLIKVHCYVTWNVPFKASSIFL